MEDRFTPSKNLDQTMAKKQKSAEQDQHEVASLAEFDMAMRQLVDVPKEDVERRTPRKEA